VPIWSLILERPYAECETWKAAVLQRLKAIRPALTVVVVAHDTAVLDPDHGSPVVQGRALTRYLDQISGEKAVIVDAPARPHDVPACLASHRSDVAACATPRKDIAGARFARLEETAAEASNALLVDMTDRICTPEVCPGVIDGMVTYRDSHHLTATFARSLAPVLEWRLRSVLAPD
jgi:hypothetical protein